MRKGDQVPDVPAAALRRRGELHSEAARLRHILPLSWAAGGGAGACQVCRARERLIVVEPVVDPSNGQRITVALCLLCCMRAVEYFDQPPPSPRKTKQGRRSSAGGAGGRGQGGGHG